MKIGELIREYLSYDPKTGDLTWVKSKGSRAAAGSIAGYIHSRGYRYIGLDGQQLRSHQVAWLLMTGDFPDNEIDHINGHQSDNRWFNLREVTHAENSRNKALHADNFSGVAGVGWHKASGKWRSRINCDGKCMYIGLFDTLLDAVAARKAAEIKHGYHLNHGRKNRGLI